MTRHQKLYIYIYSYIYICVSSPEIKLNCAQSDIIISPECMYCVCIITMLETHLYSEELPAEEVLRLRVFLLCRARLRQATSPPSQVERQYGAASTLTSSPPSISHSQAALKLTGHTGC